MVTRLWLLIKTSMEKINHTVTLYYHLILDNENGQLSLNNQKYGGNPTWRAASLHFWIEISSGSPWYSGTGRSNNECEMYALNQCTILNISFHITHSQSSEKLICMETCHPGSEWPAAQRMKHKTSPGRFNALVSRGWPVLDQTSVWTHQQHIKHIHGTHAFIALIKHQIQPRKHSYLLKFFGISSDKHDGSPGGCSHAGFVVSQSLTGSPPAGLRPQAANNITQ